MKENYQITGFFVLFLIHASQTGIGMLHFQHEIVQDAGQDAWIAVLCTGLSLHIVLWMMYKLLNNPTKDVIDIHRHCFGKYAGNTASVLLIGYFFILALTVYRGYIHILQVWVFPSLQTWELSIVLLAIFYYFISGGFRVLAGFCFCSVILSTVLLFTLYFPLQYGQIHYLFPMFNHSIPDVLASSRSSGIVFLGFESLLLYFPFLKLPKTTIKWAHIALLFSTVKYLVLLIFALVYFSQGHLKRTFWPTLEMTKMIEMQFLERFEYLFIFIWLIMIIPTVCIPLWCCTRIMKRVFLVKPKLPLALILMLLFIFAEQCNDPFKIDALRKLTSNIGMYFLFVYIPLLFVFYTAIAKIKVRRLAK